ncbi:MULTISPECIES: hypothetical protein [unclassified Psychrobacter]|uniref:hypothetical protein n=1 Tax=unclassified Psychrobacter TaxID=196806 RepID=UPI0018F65F65|nr:MULTISPECIES: hypothetical protein [unclassified Psychrobacter]
MTDLAQFPSQGDLLKFVYNATGIIPSKSKFIIDVEIDNKSLHKSLNRLAREEGDFLKSFEEHANEFRSAIYGLFSNTMYSDTLYDPLIEIFQVYTQTVLTDHTYLEKKESLLYLIYHIFLQRATISIFKYQHYYSAFLDASLSPKSKFWFLEYESTTPLACVMNWIYDCESKSLEVFHDTSEFSADESIDQIDKDLANVRNWLSGTVKLPPFSNILDVFDRAFKTHKIASDKKDRYIFFLFIARFATYCLNSLVENYSQEEVAWTLNKLKLYLGLITKDYEYLCSFIDAHRTTRLTDAESSMGESYTKIQNVYFFLNKSMEYQNFIAHHLNNIQVEYIKASSRSTKSQSESIHDIHQEILKELSASSAAQYKFIIKFFQDCLVPPNHEGYTENIKNCIYAYDVMKQRYNHQQWLNEYYEVGNDSVYPWLVHWVDGMKSFYSRDFESSLSSMRKAFETIRYSAGNRQIKFIEDYMLVALAQPNKNGNIQGWKDFKLAFKWGVFMNHFDAFPEFYTDVSDKELKVIFKDKKQSYKSFSGSSFDSKVLAKLLFHWKYDNQ